MIAWVIAGLLGMATGLRIGWVLVHKQSPVSTGMIVALGSLALVSALNWEPLTILVDSSLGWPNISVAVSQAALTACAAGSCVMITSMSASRTAVANKRWARWQYLAATVIAGASLAVFFSRGRQPEMTPREFLKRDLGGFASGTAWLVPMLYIAVALSVVLWAGMAYSNRTRRGRALFLFTVGISLLVLAVLVVAGVAVAKSEYVTIGTAATLIGCAMAMVAVGSLLPTFETWLVARREMFVLAPLYKDLKKRQPDAAIGVRPRGPLAFQVADRMAYISDALFLEAMHAQGLDPESEGEGDIELDVEPVKLEVPPAAQAHAIVKWVLTDGDPKENFPGPEWLHQPDGYSDREWILAIASEYRRLVRAEHRS
ncbi:hypothetical protein BST43_20720 [Mycobacteroides saopaulense]|uniref:Uncharacterized protein n=1 Tax=Mycobacteroides saopaulense TaxID=1578165 RepID=A0A1S4VUQ7_9MYCO|nr:hypothetical protein [Mycobacteroides saopaulense]ALR10204.1 membrane protein [Mycobacteroides saopaulense]ORB51523.1 hypothetical protein BST43_20720 [Mycobacteroides saopaulense]